MRVAGQPEVQKHGAPVWPNQHIGRLDVQMTDVLPVQAVGRPRGGRTQPRDDGGVQRAFLLQPVLQRVALDVLHDQIRQPAEIAGRDEPGHMRTGQGRQDGELGFKADDGFCPVACGHARNLHRHRKLGLATAAVRTRRMLHGVDVGHAAGMDVVPDLEAVDDGARFQQLHSPTSRRAAK